METKFKINCFAKTYYIVFIISFLLSCKQSNKTNVREQIEEIQNENTFSIEDGFFKNDLMEIISLAEKRGIGNNMFLIEYYCTTNYNRDTIVELIHARPYTCNYIKGHMKVKDHDVFLFSGLEDKLIKKEFKINKPYNDCYEYVHERPIDSPPRVQYRIKNGRIVSRL